MDKNSKNRAEMKIKVDTSELAELGNLICELNKNIQRLNKNIIKLEVVAIPEDAGSIPLIDLLKNKDGSPYVIFSKRNKQCQD